ncbi:YmL15, partial [Saguinus oedipus]
MAGPLQGGRSRALDLLRDLRVRIPAPGNRRGDQEVGEEVENVAEATKEKDKEEPGLVWALREARLHFTSESQNTGHSFRRQYKPLSLNRLQYLIDLSCVDPTQPIDLTQLVNGRGVTIQPLKRDYGVQLVKEGADTFTAKVNIKVQLASELALAPIEKNGGVTTAFYDPRSLDIECKPVPFFLRGQRIPKRMLPPKELVLYYMEAKNRGYLADPAKFPEARLELARKYGYILPDITKDELFKML